MNKFFSICLVTALLAGITQQGFCSDSSEDSSKYTNNSADQLEGFANYANEGSDEFKNKLMNKQRIKEDKKQYWNNYLKDPENKKALKESKQSRNEYYNELYKSCEDYLKDKTESEKLDKILLRAQWLYDQGYGSKVFSKRLKKMTTDDKFTELYFMLYVLEQHIY